MKKNKLLIIIVLLCIIALFLLFGRIPIPVSRISEGIQFTEDGRVSQATLTVKGIVWHHLISGIGDDRFTGSMSLTVDQKDILPEEYAKSSFNKQFFGPLAKYKSYYHSMVGFDWYDEGRNKMMNLMYYFSAVSVKNRFPDGPADGDGFPCSQCRRSPGGPRRDGPGLN